jgi:hypothetical protein
VTGYDRFPAWLVIDKLGQHRILETTEDLLFTSKHLICDLPKIVSVTGNYASERNH